MSLQTLIEDRGTQRRLVGALLLTGLALLAISIPYHRIHIDEAWIGEQAFYHSRTGFVRSELFDGFAGNGERIIVYHRLFVAAGSWLIGVFGWGIGTLRVVPLTCGIALMGLMWIYVRRVQGMSVEQALLVLSLSLLAPLNFEYIKVYRPEMMAAFFGFASMYVLHAEERSSRFPRAPLAGACAGLAMLAHPYGVVYAIAGVAFLLLVRRWRMSVAFGLAVLVPLLPAAYDVATHWELFREQLANPLVAEKTGFTLLSPLLNLLNEHQRLFRNVRTIPISALFLLATVAWFRQRDASSAAVVRYTLILMIAVGAVLQDKIDRYAILLLPFFVIVIASFIREAVARNRTPKTFRIAAAMLLALYVGYGLYFQVTTAFGEKEHIAQLNAEIARHIPKGATVVAPMNFIFNELDNYDVAATRLAAIECDGGLRANCLLEFMKKRGATHLVFSRFGAEEESLPDSVERAMLALSSSPTVRTDNYDIWRIR